MRLQTVQDVVFPSALAGEANALGVIYSNSNEAQKDQFVQHQQMVFLLQEDRAEIQRCASQHVPVLLQTHSLQTSFDVFKMSGVKMILVALKGNTPIIDFGWMGKAYEERKSVIFSLSELQKAFSQKDSGTMQEYRKLAQLLQKSKIPLGIASFAKNENERLSEEENQAWAGYLGIEKLSVQWYL